MNQPHKISIIGGGPGGLYTAVLLKKEWPDDDITVYKRNKPLPNLEDNWPLVSASLLPYYPGESQTPHALTRSDDMIKAGGIWVSPMEIESALISHPALVACAVVAKADQSDRYKLKAFVILQEE